MMKHGNKQVVGSLTQAGNGPEQVDTNEPCHEKTCLREIPTSSDSNWLAQLQKLA